MENDIKNFSKEQLKAYNIVTKTRKNVFITGPGGTGKSYLLKCIINNFNKNNIKYVVTAPTGIASINVNGQTLTSLFGISPKNDTINSIFNDKGIFKENIIKPHVKEIIKTLDILIIDEISMITKDLFNIIDIFCRYIRKIKYKPFGGLRIILFGDFLQLGPVPPLRTNIDNVNNKIKFYRNKNNNYDYIFITKLWYILNLYIIQLKTNMRQEDYDFFKLLSHIRYGNIEIPELYILYNLNISEENLYSEKYKDWIILFGSNNNKNIYNNVMLNNIKEESKIYNSKLITLYDLQKINKKELFNTIPKKLELKKKGKSYAYKKH